LIWQKNRIVYERQRQKAGFGALKMIETGALSALSLGMKWILGKIKKLLLIGEGRKFSEIKRDPLFWKDIPFFWKGVIIIAIVKGLSRLPEFINNLQP